MPDEPKTSKFSNGDAEVGRALFTIFKHGGASLFASVLVGGGCWFQFGQMPASVQRIEERLSSQEAAFRADVKELKEAVRALERDDALRKQVNELQAAHAALSARVDSMKGNK